MAFIVFALTFFLIVNKHLIKSFFEGFIKGREKSEDISDPKILNFVKEKSGLHLKKIKLLDTRTTWGMMAGLPGAPYMIISRDAYENFSKDEMQWLLLHEAGHYVLGHNLKLIFLQMALLIAGIFLILLVPSVLMAIFLGIVLAAVETKLARRFEYQANYFALSKMNNPKGLKNIYEKAKARWRKKKKKDSLLQKLFNVWTLDIYKDLESKAQS